jgi:Ion transport protein
MKIERIKFKKLFDAKFHKRLDEVKINELYDLLDESGKGQVVNGHKKIKA